MVKSVIAGSINRVVVGLGATGLSCARFLYRNSRPFTVVDTRDQPPGLAQLQREMPEIPVRTGALSTGLLAGADELVVSPGIGLDEPFVASAIANGAKVIGDIDLFVREACAPVVGITGSNAKSTVTEMVGCMAAAAGLNTGVGGNLGTPALDLLQDDRELYVLELSSFQLERCESLGLAVATVLNISPDHLDRHGSLPAYHRAKHRIFHGCGKAVVNSDDPLTVPLLSSSVDVHSWRMGEPELAGFGLQKHDGREYLVRGFDSLLAVDELGLAGRHNVANALAALAIGEAAGLPRQAMIEALRSFDGLAHRCQMLGEIGGVRYIDDSKGTNTGATRAALEGLGGERDVVLIAGGVGKGADFSSLRTAVARHCKQLILIGQDAAALQLALADVVPTLQAASLQEAVEEAQARASRGDTVLLSPACASFDMFANYMERGEAFSRAVTHLREGGQ